MLQKDLRKSFIILLLLNFNLNSSSAFLFHKPETATTTATASTTTFRSALAAPLAFQRSGHNNPKNNHNNNSALHMTMQKQKEDQDVANANANANAATSLPLDNLTSYANSYAAANGLQVETKQQSSSSNQKASSSYQCAPISLLPNAFPATAFENAKALAPYFNQLVDRISRDGDFLTETLAGTGGGGNGSSSSKSVISKDAYTKKLLELYTAIYMNDDVNFAKSADRLGIQRSDYMLNPIASTLTSTSSTTEYGLKQVELNTIAASFAGLAVNVAGLHQMMTERFDRELEGWFEANIKAVKGETTNDDGIDGEVRGVPTNPALDRLPFAMHVAHEQYQSRFVDVNDNDVKTAILFVVQEGETNTVDQRMLEFQLWNNHRIPVIRMSLTAANKGLRMDEANGALYVNVMDPDSDTDEKYEYEVSVAYFRAGYAPTDFPDGDNGIEWASRELIERSRATKCPQLGYHLAGTKKVQQELARPGVLERFFSEEEIEQGIVTKMREVFAGLFSLGEDAVQEDLDAIMDAISSEDGHGRYVLKPQREGGGYNYYGEDLANKIKENVDVEEGSNGGSSSLTLGEDLAEFILMQRLFPPKQNAVLLRAGLVEGTGESISELGCFGTILQSYDGQTTLHNEYSGFLLRTKFSNVDEGGVASGFATLSSPYLC